MVNQYDQSWKSIVFSHISTTNKYDLPVTILREMAFSPHFAQNSDPLFCAKRYSQYLCSKITTSLWHKRLQEESLKSRRLRPYIKQTCFCSSLWQKKSRQDLSDKRIVRRQVCILPHRTLAIRITRQETEGAATQQFLLFAHQVWQRYQTSSNRLAGSI